MLFGNALGSKTASEICSMEFSVMFVDVISNPGIAALNRILML